MQIKLISPAEALRCFVYLSDARIAFSLLIAFEESGHTYNLYNPNAEIRIRDFFSLVTSLTGPPLEICVEANQDGDFQESCHSLAATQAAWIKGSSRFGLVSSIGLLIHTSAG